MPPSFIRQMQPELVSAPPIGPGWLHEIKHDGYRMHARIAQGTVQLLDPQRPRLEQREGGAK